VEVEQVATEITDLSAAAIRRRPLELAIVVPTLNERDNVRTLIDLIEQALPAVEWEVVFVDDNSNDGTADVLREIGRIDPRVRVLQRIGRRGLSSAVVEGMLATPAPVFAVMDADLQHDETILPILFAAITERGADLAVASRYIAGGSSGDWSAERLQMSRLATRLCNMVIKTEISDPMSGFFAIRREVLVDALPRLSNIGFKILMDLVASTSAPLKVEEIPYTFKSRVAGESKLDAKVTQEFAVLLLEKMFGHIIPVRFLMFAAVGSLGVIVHLTTLRIMTSVFGLDFLYGQAIATMVAMTSNFVLNNSTTYRDMRLKGADFIRGLFLFYAVSSVGAVANVGIGEMVFQSNHIWWLSGLAGSAVAVVWNYAASSFVTWKRK
jgi:dolichol-phosphate mannosyltransferase